MPIFRLYHNRDGILESDIIAEDDSLKAESDNINLSSVRQAELPALQAAIYVQAQQLLEHKIPIDEEQIKIRASTAEFYFCNGDKANLASQQELYNLEMKELSTQVPVHSTIMYETILDPVLVLFRSAAPIYTTNMDDSITITHSEQWHLEIIAREDFVGILQSNKGKFRGVIFKDCRATELKVIDMPELRQDVLLAHKAQQLGLQDLPDVVELNTIKIPSNVFIYALTLTHNDEVNKNLTIDRIVAKYNDPNRIKLEKFYGRDPKPEIISDAMIRPAFADIVNIQSVKNTFIPVSQGTHFKPDV